MLSSVTRSERIIIVDDDGLRSVVVGPSQRLRPAFFLAAALVVTSVCALGWIVTAAELLRTRQTVEFSEDGSRALAAQLAESRAQVAALSGELEVARGALTQALADDEGARARVGAALAALAAAEGKEGAQAARALKQAVASARDELTPLAERDATALTAAERSLETLENASRELAARRAQAAMAAVDVAAAQADAPASDDPNLQAEGLAMALVEAQGEAARLRSDAALAREERDALAARMAETEARMAALAEGQVALLARLTEHADVQVARLEEGLKETGIDLDGALAELDRTRFATGGPLVGLAEFQPTDMPVAATEALAALEAQLGRRARLQALSTLLPLSAPADDYYVTSGFGTRRDPWTKQTAAHTGVDLVARFRSPVTAAAPGTVTFAGWESGYGRMVEIDHGFGVRTRYAHLDKISVKKGEEIAHGGQLGTLGNSGRSTGPHLHYEVMVDGKAVDPLRFMERGRHVCQS